MIRSVDQQEKHVESFQDSTDAPAAPLTPSTSPTQDAFKIVILRIQYEINGLAIDSSWHAKVDLSLQPSQTEVSRIGLHHGRIFEGSLLKISKDKEQSQSKAKLEGIEILFSGKTSVQFVRYETNMDSTTTRPNAQNLFRPSLPRQPVFFSPALTDQDSKQAAPRPGRDCWVKVSRCVNLELEMLIRK